MTDDNSNKVVARLHGGPSAGVRLWVETNPKGLSPWPSYLCLNMKQGMPMHYTLVSSGVYEFGGACAEFDHDPQEHVQRCACCGAKILPGSDVHPERAERPQD